MGFFGIYNKARAISLYRVQVIRGFTWESVSPNQFFQCWISRVVACILGISYRNFSANCLILERSGGNRLCNDITHKPWLPNYPPRVLSQQTNEFVASISLSETNTATIIIWIRKLSHPHATSKNNSRKRFESYSLLLPKNCPMNTSELCFKTFQDMYT